MHFQPIVDLRTRLVRGLEALVRLRQSKNRLLGPDVLRPALQDPVMSVQIDEIVLDRALRHMRDWLDARVPVTGSCVNVNVSETQLSRPDLFDLVEAPCGATT